MDRRKILLVSPTLSDSLFFCQVTGHHLNVLWPGWWNGLNEKYGSFEIITKFGVTRGDDANKIYGSWNKEGCLQFLEDMKNYDGYLTSIKLDSYNYLYNNGLLDNLKEASKDCYHILLFKRDFIDTVLSLCLLNSEEQSVDDPNDGLKRRRWYESTDPVTVTKEHVIDQFYYLFETYADFILGNKFGIKFDEIMFSEELRNVKTFKQIMEKTKLAKDWNYEGIPMAGPDPSISFSKQGYISNYYQTVFWIIELLQLNIDNIHVPTNQPEFKNIDWGIDLSQQVSILSRWVKQARDWNNK
mgnify:CR=1 FL=1|tara:strand:- start:13208 stop:14104 length:897 start_codon:yes stop_codon:yes gene_type:complete